ncbi:DUF1217 domain-containing protein [Roseibium sediminicola]|uniref:DUF1217 domain-containing protein n=1 Tax=Roseibium sediminicola TaxID=2933272 RepID=A0ABT0GPZ4_9HYPH|nr:DUF1217 domain-containing protein [Roseibium sp. CAU 1639]MCK7611310.1 DUF1217 domain-containing protein [Roseibium sp. CAU 1639]
MINTLTQVQLVRTNMERSLKTVAADPTVERQSEYYLENIRNIKSVDEFLADDRIFSYAMTAMGLEDMTYAKAFIRKVLEEGTDDRTAFANQLADTKYKDFAETFNFKRYGETATSFSRTQDGIVAKFHRQTLEVREGEQNQGVRLALYFERRAPDITSAYDVLADRALAETVYTSLGLPQEFAMTDIDKQAAYLEEHLDFDMFGDADYLSKFLSRFSALYDLANGPVAVNSPVLSLYGNSNGVIPMGEGLLASIQKLRLGGF